MMIRYRCANVENSINLHKQVALLSNPARPTSQPSLHVQIEVAEQLLDRLEDCKRTFPVVAVLGGCGGPVLQRLGGGRAGIEQVIYLDSSRDMLSCVKQKQQVSSKAPPSTSQQLASYACRMHSFRKNKRTQRWLKSACLPRKMAEICCSFAVRALQGAHAEGGASIPRTFYIQGDEEMLPLRRHSVDCKTFDHDAFFSAAPVSI